MFLPILTKKDYSVLISLQIDFGRHFALDKNLVRSYAHQNEARSVKPLNFDKFFPPIKIITTNSQNLLENLSKFPTNQPGLADLNRPDLNH